MNGLYGFAVATLKVLGLLALAGSIARGARRLWAMANLTAQSDDRNRVALVQVS